MSWIDILKAGQFRTKAPIETMTTNSLKSDAMRCRKAFVMAVNPGQIEQYVRRHNPIWPELAAVLKTHGVLNYSIFYHQTTRQLFGYVEIQDEVLWAAIAQTEVCKRWWQHMSDLMPTNEDRSPASAGLSEVFHLD